MKEEDLSAGKKAALTRLRNSAAFQRMGPGEKAMAVKRIKYGETGLTKIAKKAAKTRKKKTSKKKASKKKTKKRTNAKKKAKLSPGKQAALTRLKKSSAYGRMTAGEKSAATKRVVYGAQGLTKIAKKAVRTRKRKSGSRKLRRRR